MATRSYFYRFTSQLDGKPCVLIINGTHKRSGNSKTDAMIQSWIMREDIDPYTATKTGDDASVCGSCPHRWFLGGACYVLVHRAPLAIYKAYRNGSYAPLDLDDEEQLRRLRDRPFRCGSYGDPAALPSHFWPEFWRLVKPSRWTGYTHAWKLPAHQGLKRWLMASVDSRAEQALAAATSWRTFRIAEKASDCLSTELSCPASAEQGHRLTCASCGACNGFRGLVVDPWAMQAITKASVAIPAHGQRKKRFVPLVTI